MPMITITALKGRSADQKRKIGDILQAALIAIGIPENDRFQRFFDMESEDFIYDALYPNLAKPRTPEFTMIEILFSIGRSVKVKKVLLQHIIKGMTEIGIQPEDVFVVFRETAWENWAFANGEIFHI